uniref:diguanylate cyclase domain-containing protein n=2 Tax=Aliarcobacter sp. TaxID=2321116 RepID=UPI0040483B31
MFKNSLFLKIILIFTLPALGILYFSTVLVYDKIESFNEVDGIRNNLVYLKTTENALSSLQKERELTINLLLSKANIEQLNKQRINTNKLLELLEDLKSSSSNFNQIKFEKEKLKNLRDKIDNSDISLFNLIEDFNKLNKQLLDSLSTLRPIKLAVDFNSDLRNIIHFLNYKESTWIEKLLINVFLVNHQKYSDENLVSLLLKNYSMQDINKNYFFNNTNIDVIQSYNSKLQEEYYNKIFVIRSNIKDKNFSKINLSIKEWEELSSENINSLIDMYSSLIIAVEKYTIAFEEEAKLEKQKSLIFLFVCFSTLISLLFVLRNIIFNEQKSFYKVQKHKEVYELLNKANKFLLKIDDKKRLYSNICELLAENNMITFCFIYDVIDNEIIAQEGDLKNRLITQMPNYSDITKENIVSKTMKWETNIIINSFEKKNISTFYEDAKNLKINSMASFPIKKFNKIIGTLVLYSKEQNFFDDEIEILFDKLISDVTHCLEKIDYEEIRFKQEDELRLSSYAFESSEPMIITNDVGEIVKVNQAFCTAMGYAREDILGKNPRIFKSAHQDKKFGDDLWNDLKVKGCWSGEVYNKKANEQIIPLRSTITAVKNNDGKITHFLGQYFDIGEQKDKEKILEYQATHDNLTGLPNRLLLLDRIEHAITKVVRHKIIGGLIFIDLDNFKEVNDTLGHDIGDLLLITVAKTIREIVRDEDTIARIGGDEFIILLDSIGNNKDIAKINITNLAEKIKDGLNAITHLDGHINVSTPSIGITLFSDASVSVKDIIKQADTAMYVAKKQGKNSIEFFD